MEIDAADLLAAMRTRRSIRRYETRAVPEDVVWRLLEAARWAPSAHNRQPWRFVVLIDPVQRLRLARAMGERFRSDLAADGLPAEVIERQVARSEARIGGAPVAIVLCLSMAEMDKYPDPRRQQAERVMAIQGVALAAQNILLLAYAEGLGACWMCAPLFCPDVVRETLALPTDWDAQGLITLGYPAEQRSRDRESIEAKTRWF